MFFPLLQREKNLIDLAGSESSKTETTGLRRKEGSYINKSLLTLGTVIGKLSEGKASHVPYRDSKLTRLLQSSLSGHGHVYLICTITPASSNMEETHNTLKFASRAKRVEIHASRNKIIDEKSLIKKYQREISSLKEELDQFKKGMLVGVNHEELLVLKQQVEEGLYNMQSGLEEEEAKAALMSIIQRLTMLILVSSKNTLPGLVDLSPHQRNHSASDDDHDGSGKLGRENMENSTAYAVTVPANAYDLKHKRSSSKLNDDLSQACSTISEITQAGELISGISNLPLDEITMSDQMDLQVEQVKMLAGDIAFDTSTLNRTEQSADGPESCKAQAMLYLNLDNPPSFELESEPTLSGVTDTEVQRYQETHDIVEHLELVTRDNTKLTDEIIDLEGIVVGLNGGIMLREACTDVLLGTQANMKEREQMVAGENAKLIADNEQLKKSVDNLNGVVKVRESRIADLESAQLLTKASVEAQLATMCAEIEGLNSKISEKTIYFNQIMAEKNNNISETDMYIESQKKILAEREDRIRYLTEEVLKLQERALATKAAADSYREELLKYTDPSDTQFVQNSLVIQQIETAEQLYYVSAEKKVLEEQRAESEVVIEVQKQLITKLTTVAHGVHDTVTPKPKNEALNQSAGYVEPIRMMALPETICVDDGDRVPRTDNVGGSNHGDVVVTEPSSLIKRVKDRTSKNERQPKNLSPFVNPCRGRGVGVRCQK